MSLTNTTKEFTDINIPSRELIEEEVMNLSSVMNYLSSRMRSANKPDLDALAVLDSGLKTCEDLRNYMNSQNQAIARLIMAAKTREEPKEDPIPTQGLKPNEDFFNNEDDIF